MIKSKIAKRLNKHIPGIFLGLMVLCLLAGPAGAAYAYVQSFNINSTADLTDYQMKIVLSNATGTSVSSTIYTGGLTQSDWRDVQFNWLNNGVLGAECPYWLDVKNQTANSITAYVKVPYIYANDTAGLRMYYGDASATAKSNGTATFVLFDDFSGSSLNSTWVSSGTGTAVVGGGGITVIGGDIHVRSASTFGTNQILMGRLQTNKWNTSTGLIQFGYNYYGPSDTNENYYTQINFAHIDPTSAGAVAHSTNPGVTKVKLAAGDWAMGTYGRVELIRTSTTTICKINDVTKATLATTYYPTVALCPYIRSYYANDTIVADYIAVRQYTATEPTLMRAPDANFGVDENTGNMPFTVHFTDLSKYSPTSWSWNFGDGSSSTEQNPTHTYTSPGIHTVTLTVSNAAGSDSSSLNTNTIPPSPSVSFNFTRLSQNNVQFTDTSTNYPASWSWDFGDGTTSTDQNPIHNYTKFQQYTVTLTVTNAGGSSSNTTQYNHMFVPPNNYSQYKDVMFTKNMTAWDFPVNLTNFYTSFMPSWFFWLVILLIPYIGMYTRQGGIEIIAVIYLFTGGFLAFVMPAVLAPFAKWFLILGGAGVIYKLFIRD